MSIALLTLLSKSLTYVKPNNTSPLEPSRTPYRIIIIFPSLVEIARKHRNLTAPYYGCIYIWSIMLLLSHRERQYFISFFILTRGISLIWYRCFPRLIHLCWQYWTVYRCFFRFVCRFWCMAPRLRFNHDGKLVLTSAIPFKVLCVM